MRGNVNECPHKDSDTNMFVCGRESVTVTDLAELKMQRLFWAPE